MSHPTEAFSGRLVPSLTRRGVSADADLLYRHLVRSGPNTTGNLAAALGMSNRRVGLALDELIAIEAVSSQSGPRRSGRPWAARPLPR